MPKREYAALIFDCDGTLTDSMPVHYVAWNRTMNRYGIVFTEERFYQLGGMPTEKIIERLSQEQHVPIEARKASHEKEQAFLEMLDQLRPVNDVYAVAQAFRGRLPMAVASGGYREIILKQLYQIQCLDWFDVVVTAEDTLHHKPAPDVFLKAAERLGVPPQDCLVYEDSDLGVQAARAAKMDVIDIRHFHRPIRITTQ
jgi:beta-phosphoglucomutase family hydrolase